MTPPAETDYLSLAVQNQAKGRQAPQLSEKHQAILARVENRASNELLFGLKYHVMRRCFLDLAYYNGFQHVYWNYKRHKINQIPLKKGATRVTDNKIMPAVQRAVKILTSKVDFHVRPKNSDFRSRASARMGERAMRHLYRTKRWSRKLRNTMRWCAVTGVGFVRPFWNPNAGPEVEYFIDPSDGLPIPPEQLSEDAKALLRAEGMVTKVREGEVDLAVHSPFEVYVPDTATDTDDLQWYLIAERRSLDWIRQRWPKQGKYVAPEKFTSWESTSFEARILSMAGGGVESGFEGFAGSLEYDDDKSAILKTYVEPPTADNPKGMYAVVAGGVLLEIGDSPSYTFGLNGSDLVKFDFIERPGSFWPISLPENMISPQRLLNNNQGQITDIRKNVLKPKMLAARGAVLGKSNFYDVTAEIIEYDEEKPPPAWQPFPPLPGALFGVNEMHQASLRDLSAQHEAMQGENPAGVRSGFSINLLRERDLDFYQPIIENHAEAYSVLWGHVHQMVKKTWTTPREIQDISRDELVWTGWVNGDDLEEDASVIV